MSLKKTHITYLDDNKGDTNGVQLSPMLWARVKKRLINLELILTDDNTDPALKPEPFMDLDDLKNYWDFPYAYSPDVKCDGCGTTTMDWENDPNRPFYLTNANFAGLIVFRCAHCNATIRKMHFKDHVAFETKTNTIK